MPELRKRLGHYLARVRRGDEVVIRDRGRAVARLVPVAGAAGHAAAEADPVAAGILRLPERPLPASFLRTRAPRVRGGGAVAAPVFSEVASATLRLLNVPPTLLETVEKIESPARGGAA